MLSTSVKIGVIIPCFNAEATLEKCISSVLRQSYKNLELIVVDDASTDNTSAIVERLANTDSRVKLIKNPSNRGQGYSRNLATQLCSADFITYLDADDYLDDQVFFEICVQKLLDGVDLLFTPAVRELESNKFSYDKFDCIDGVYRKETVLNLYLSRKLGTHAAWGKFYSAGVIKKARFVECGFSQDVIFVVDAILAAHKIQLFSNYGYVYSQLGLSTWRTDNINLNHVLSGLRLLAEVIVKNRLEPSIVLAPFLKIWNKDHGTRLRQYIKKGQISNFDISVLQKFLQSLGELFNLLLSNIQDFQIRKFLIDAYFQTIIINHVKVDAYSNYFNYAEGLCRCFYNEQSAIVGNRLVISITSYPARINACCEAIRSILNQELPKGSLFVLYLSETEFPDKLSIPKFLLEQSHQGNLLIKWEKENLRSYKKLIPALRDYPNNPILTIDDDVIYPSDLVCKLYHEYLISPKQIHCTRCRRVILDRSKKFSPYACWPIESRKEPVVASYDLLFTGVGGVLYPPHSLNDLVKDSSLFETLCPNGDDIWFWLMALLNGTKIHRIDDFLDVESLYVQKSQEVALWRQNVVNGNDRILREVAKEFPFIIDLLIAHGCNIKNREKDVFIAKLRKKIYRNFPTLYQVLSKTKHMVMG